MDRDKERLIERHGEIDGESVIDGDRHRDRQRDRRRQLERAVKECASDVHGVVYDETSLSRLNVEYIYACIYVRQFTCRLSVCFYMYILVC